MSNWSKESVQEAVNKVIEKASKDEKFRALCQTNIHAAIREVSGAEVPASFKINVVDNTGYHINVTLPPLQKADGELGDSELESVAGGSKSGAEDFFNDVGNAVVDVGNTAVDVAQEGVTGSVEGTNRIIDAGQRHTR